MNSDGLPPVASPPLRTTVEIIQDEFESVPIVLVGSVDVFKSQIPNDNASTLDEALRWNFIAAFERELGGQLLSFEAVEDGGKIVMKDQEGNFWDVFGRAVEGPRARQQLKCVNAGLGYWFVFGTMYPGAMIHGGLPQTLHLNLQPAENWTIPTNFVFDGAGFNGIPSINEPKFMDYTPGLPVPITEENDLVVLVSRNGETKAYPHSILDYHEVVNDELGGVSIVLTYCPLTGTAKVWDVTGKNTGSFGVSGLLYNSNLLPFDRGSRSYWHQLEGAAVHGSRMGEQLPLLPHLEMPWAKASRMFNHIKVLSNKTGFDRNYNLYPYGDYKTNHDLLLVPITYHDNRLPAKERVFAVLINGKAKVYRASDFF